MVPGRSRGCSCVRDPSLGAAVRGLFGLAGILLLAVGVLGALVFRKVDSISEEISSSQTLYERKLLSLQEDLQGLGARSSGNGSSALRDAAALGRELSELQRELERIQETLQAQEILLERTSRSHARLSSAGSSMWGGLRSCSASLGNVSRSLEQLRERAGRCQGVTALLRDSLRAQARQRSQAGEAAERLNSSLEQNSRRLRALQGQAGEAALALRGAVTEWHKATRDAGTLRSASSRGSELLRSLQAGLASALRETSRNSDGMQELALQLLALQLQLDNICSQLDEQQESAQDLRHRRGHGRNRTQERLQELQSRLESLRSESRAILANVGATGGHVRGMLRFLGAVRSSCARELRGQAEEMRGIGRSLGMLQEATEELRERSGMLGARLELGVRNLSVAVQEMRAVDARHGEVLRDGSGLRGERQGERGFSRDGAGIWEC
ncbi:scavenger receptor class A member 3 [Acridotheres tristis]